MGQHFKSHVPGNPSSPGKLGGWSPAGPFCVHFLVALLAVPLKNFSKVVPHTRCRTVRYRCAKMKKGEQQMGFLLPFWKFCGCCIGVQLSYLFAVWFLKVPLERDIQWAPHCKLWGVFRRSSSRTAQLRGSTGLPPGYIRPGSAT